MSAPRRGHYFAGGEAGMPTTHRDPGRARRDRAAATQLSGREPPGPDKKWIVGVDLGGTNIVVGVLPLDGGDGEVLALRSVPTEAARGAKFVVDRMVSLIHDA